MLYSEEGCRMRNTMTALIVAFAKNQVIGNKGCIPWKIKGEQKRFRELTTGNVVIMGRRSYEEIGRPLPDRTTIVVSGTKKTVELKPLEWRSSLNPEDKNQVTYRYTRTKHDWHAPAEMDVSTPLNRYDGMMMGFAQMVRSEKENPYTPDYELALFKIILECCGIHHSKD